MKEFVLFFRMDLTNKNAQPTKKQMETYMQQWMSWINEISDNNQLADGGNHLSKKGRVIGPNNEIKESPYISENSSLAGYIIINAKDMKNATDIAKRCPILLGDNTSVEIRETNFAG